MEKMRKRGSLDRLPLLWKHMLMMVSVLLLALTALGISNRQTVRSLTREQLNKFAIGLERDCAMLSDAMYMTIAIPDGVEGTRYYDYLKGVSGGVLENKYFPVLNYLRKALNNQVYLQGDSAATALYLRGVNSMVTNNHNYPVAEDCLEEYFQMSQLGIETVLGCLRERSSITLLPLQPVQLEKGVFTPCLTLIMQPGGGVTVMSFYEKDTVLEYLSIPYLPQGTGVRLSAKDGRVLLEENPDPGRDHYLLTASLEDFQVLVELWIPASYFDRLLRPVRLTGVGSMTLVAVLGLALSYVLSSASVRPIRRLLSDHDREEAPETNEITRLDRLLRSTSQQSRELKDRLLRQLLARCLTGAVLSAREEDFLRKELGTLADSYQVAILHCDDRLNVGLRDHLRQTLEAVAVTTLSDKETGLLLRAGEPAVKELTQEVERLNMLPDTVVHCGVSAPAEQLEALHVAVRQARLALPRERGLRLFPGEAAGSSCVSWLQHERLYQSVFSGDETEASQLLRSIAAQCDHASGRETYYNVRFVLRSAAQELEILLDEDREYAQNLLPRENILSLEPRLRQLFRGLEERRRENMEDLHSRVLAFVRQDLSDYDLSAPKVAETLGLTEKRVYEILRKETGMTFREYLTSLRMKKAARLLGETAKGIGDIAQECGYQSSSTFYRLFQEAYGMSPGQFRKEAANREKDLREP